MKKLLIFGDSILRGVTYSEEQNRHKLCEGYKLERLRSLGFDVINKARMGATIVKGLDMLEYTLPEVEPGSIVLFEFGGNDCDYDWSAIATDPDGNFLPHTPEENFLSLYSNAIEKALASGAEVVLSNMVPVDAERYLKWISRDNSYENIMKWLGDVSMLYRFQEHYNRLVEDLARKYNLPLIDLRGSFLLSHRYKTLISRDGIHPTEAGHDLIEDTIGKFLSPMRKPIAVN